MAGSKGRGKGEGENSERRIVAKNRQALALRLRTHGATYQQIADEIGYATAYSAQLAVNAALKATLAEPAAEYRAMHRQRIEGVLRSFAPGMMAGVPRSGEVYLAALAQLAKLDGLDAPQKFSFDETMEAQTRAAARELGVDEEWAVGQARKALVAMASAK